MFSSPLLAFSFICGVIGLILVILSFLYLSVERNMINDWETKYHKYDAAINSLANREEINKEQLGELSEEKWQKAVNSLRNIQKIHKTTSLFSTIGILLIFISSIVSFKYFINK